MALEATQTQMAAATAYNQFRDPLKPHSAELQTQFLNIAEKAAKEGGSFDTLTSLRNRAGLNNRIEDQLQILKREKNSNTGIMYYGIDLNTFKKVNDKYGHGVGDELLIKVAGILNQSAKREVDTVARISGDEFAISTTSKLAEYAKDKLQERIFKNMEELKEEFQLRFPDLPEGTITLSMGRSFFTLKEIDELKQANPNIPLADLLAKNADRAMYLAKVKAHETNGNSFAVFKPEDSQTNMPPSPAQRPQVRE
jgi:diguanylate cyclase (GGDEF)-like protein